MGGGAYHDERLRSTEVARKANLDVQINNTFDHGLPSSIGIYLVILQRTASSALLQVATAYRSHRCILDIKLDQHFETA
jgi:hypothetical protein